MSNTTFDDVMAFMDVTGYADEHCAGAVSTLVESEGELVVV